MRRTLTHCSSCVCACSHSPLVLRFSFPGSSCTVSSDRMRRLPWRGRSRPLLLSPRAPWCLGKGGRFHGDMARRPGRPRADGAGALPHAVIPLRTATEAGQTFDFFLLSRADRSEGVQRMRRRASGIAGTTRRFAGARRLREVRRRDDSQRIAVDKRGDEGCTAEHQRSTNARRAARRIQREESSAARCGAPPRWVPFF